MIPGARAAASCLRQSACLGFLRISTSDLMFVPDFLEDLGSGIVLVPVIARPRD